jgi:hypothetical protein
MPRHRIRQLAQRLQPLPAGLRAAAAADRVQRPDILVGLGPPSTEGAAPATAATRAEEADQEEAGEEGEEARRQSAATEAEAGAAVQELPGVLPVLGRKRTLLLQLLSPERNRVRLDLRMRTTRAPIGLTTALIIVVATTASAGGTSTNPKALVLQKADLPASAVKGPSFAVAPSTFGDRDFTVYYNLRVPGREEVLTSDVAVSRQAKAAARGYRLMVATYSSAQGLTPLKLPAYGSEQRAVYNAGTGSAVLIVRKNTTVWRLAVESCSPLSPAGCLGGRTPPKLTKPQASSELRKYARKQKARIGNG